MDDEPEPHDHPTESDHDEVTDVEEAHEEEIVDLFPDNRLPPPRKYSVSAITSLLLAVLGWGVMILRWETGISLELASVVAGGLFAAAGLAARLAYIDVMSSSRRPKGGEYFFIGAIVACFGVVAIVYAWGTRPEVQPAPRKQDECVDRMRRIVKMYQQRSADGQLLGATRGSPQLIEWAREAAPDDFRMLVCPRDPKAHDPEYAEDRRQYVEMDLARPESVVGRVSYGLRDLERFPVGDPTLSWVICCRQGLDGNSPGHGDGILVGFADGTVRLVRRSELGVEPGNPIKSGRGSTHRELQKILFVE